jgi:hypothetical protein
MLRAPQLGGERLRLLQNAAREVPVVGSGGEREVECEQRVGEPR